MKRPAIVAPLSVCLLATLSACANTIGGEMVEDLLAADPQLQENSATILPEEKASVGDRPPESPLPQESNQSEDRGVTLPSPTPSEGNAEGNSNQVADANGGAASLETPELEDNQIPQPLRSYIQDLIEVGVLGVETTGDRPHKKALAELELNKSISRRQYARWLLTANNLLYSDNPSKQIRLASKSASPAFQDLLSTDPDFPIIQGLAEAGIIPSQLTGDSTIVLFRPEAPLTRERMILWKVPLDTRRALPAATIEAVEETWGFQDTSKIDPKPLKAVLADFQNGENANIRRSFGYTMLLMPKKAVSRAEAGAAIWYFGYRGDGISARDVKPLNTEKIDNAVD